MKKILQTLLLATMVAAVPVSAFGIELKITDRSPNKWKLQPDWTIDSDKEIDFNRKDCLDDVGIILEWADLDAADGAEAALYIGSGCDDDPSEDDDGCKVYELTSNTANGNNKFPLTTLFPFKEDGCTGTKSVEVKVVKGDDVRNKDIKIAKSNIVTVSFDGDPPDAPVLSATDPGNKKVVVNWDNGEDDEDGGTSSSTLDPDIKEILVLWYDVAALSGSDSDSDGDADSDTGTDTSEAETDQDTTSQTDDAGDTPLDAGADLMSRIIPFQTTADGEDTSVDSEGETPSSECPSGGLSGGEDYYKDSSIHEKKVTSPSSGKATIGKLTNGQAYLFAVVGLDEHRNPSLLSNTECETPGETIGFSQLLGDAGGKGGKFCFIATQAFGSYDHRVVRILRTFRDEFLEPLPGGKSLIAAYYDVGPRAARAISKSPMLMNATRAGLTLFAYATMPLSMLGPLGALLLGLFTAAGMTLIQKRRRR